MHPEKTAQTTPVHVRQAAKQRVETAYAHAPLMLAHDRRVLDVPLEERLQSRTSELLAWAKTMLPVINRSVRDARTHYKLVIKTSAVTSPATVVTTGDTAATPPVPSTARPEAATPPYRPARPEAATPPVPSPVVLTPILDRRRFQSARTRIATLSYDIRQYFRHRR
jgi:hypothetical protein